jgi:hypothetical protein
MRAADVREVDCLAPFVGACDESTGRSDKSGASRSDGSCSAWTPVQPRGSQRRAPANARHRRRCGGCCAGAPASLSQAEADAAIRWALAGGWDDEARPPLFIYDGADAVARS